MLKGILKLTKRPLVQALSLCYKPVALYIEKKHFGVKVYEVTHSTLSLNLYQPLSELSLSNCPYSNPICEDLGDLCSFPRSSRSDSRLRLSDICRVTELLEISVWMVYLVVVVVGGFREQCQCIMVSACGLQAPPIRPLFWSVKVNRKCVISTSCLHVPHDLEKPKQTYIHIKLSLIFYSRFKVACYCTKIKKKINTTSFITFINT